MTILFSFLWFACIALVLGAMLAAASIIFMRPRSFPVSPALLYPFLLQTVS